MNNFINKKKKKQKENERNKSTDKLWIIPLMWKLMDNSFVKLLVELPTIPTIAWTTPLIEKLIGVAHITHNTVTTISDIF